MSRACPSAGNSAKEFINRVHERTIFDNDNPEHVTRAMFADLSEHVRDGEFDDLIDQLLQDAETAELPDLYRPRATAIRVR